MLKRSLALLAFLCLVFVLTSCGEPMTVEEIRVALPALIDASKPLNEIYFGDGFDVAGENSDVSAMGGYYYCDCEKYGLYSVTEIKEATEKVFTSDYAAILYLSAFEGISTDTAVEAPKYSEGELGLMQSLNADIYELPDRVYDYDSIKIVKEGKDSTTISISSTANDVTQDVEMVIVRYVDESAPTVTNTDGENVPAYIYRLDSPTY